MKIYFLAFSLLFIFSCSQTGSTLSSTKLSPEQAAAQKSYEIIKPVKQVQDYRLNGWTYIDSQNIIMYSSPKRWYLLTLKRPCHDLRSTEDISIETRTGVLMAGLDAISIVGKHNALTAPCYIEAIYLLQKTTDKKLETSTNN